MSNDREGAEEELREILSSPITGRSITKSRSPSYRSISSIEKPPSRTSCNKKDIEMLNSSFISTCESTESLN